MKIHTQGNKMKYSSTYNNQNRLLKRLEVAERLGVHTETVKRYQRRGILPAIVLNSRVTRYEQSAVERLINEGRVET